MKTYLTIYFDSEGVKPSEVTELLKKLGFEPMHGPYDFVYDWKGSAGVEDVIRFGDRVKALLKRLKIYYKMETV